MTQIAVDPGNDPAQGPANGRWILIATVLGSSMAFIDGTVVNVALPAMQSAFHANGSGMQWIVESYALCLAALLLLGGSLGDIYGRRRVFLSGVVLFAVASLACGLAQSLAFLIAARAVQGVGGALLIPGSLALISASFSEQERGRAIGTWSGSTAITASIGPLLGGWLVQHASWRWVFFLNVPLALAVVVISLLRVPESKNERSSSPDWMGAVLATSGLGALTFALIESSNGVHGTVTVGVIGVALLLAFVLVEGRSSHPMLPLQLFRSRNFSAANLMTFFIYSALGGVLYYLPLNLIQVQHYSPPAAGAALLPIILLIFLLSRWSGGLVSRFGPKLPLVTGASIASSGYALLLLARIGGSYWANFFPGILALGLGLAISVAPLTTTVMGSVEQQNSGTASGVNNAISRVASLVAIAALGVVFSSVFATALHPGLQHSSLSPEAQAALYAQRSSLAGIHTTDADSGNIVAAAFMRSFRVLLACAAGLSVAATVIAGLLISAGKENLAA